MQYITLTQGYSAIIDDEDFELVNNHKWHLIRDRNGILYAGTYIKHKYVLMHRLLLGLFNIRLQGDHINRNGLDNRRHNLRTVTHSQNQINKVYKNTKNKYRGVHFNSKTKQYVCELYKDGIRYRKRFRNEISAAKYYNELAMQHHKEFAVLNTFD
jgi:hypothetical protein